MLLRFKANFPSVINSDRIFLVFAENIFTVIVKSSEKYDFFFALNEFNDKFMLVEGIKVTILNVRLLRSTRPSIRTSIIRHSWAKRTHLGLNLRLSEMNF